MKLTIEQYRALNSKKRIVSKGLKEKAKKEKKRPSKPDSREVNYDER